MAVRNQVDPKTLAADRAALLALEDVADYAPRNAAYSIPELRGREARLTRAEQAAARAYRAFELAREERIAAGHAFHDGMLGAKAEVVVQYGEDSPVVESVGLKRKSQYRRSTGRRPLARKQAADAQS